MWRLTAIQNKLLGLLQNKKEEIIAITNKHGAFNVRVFGSVARDEASIDSDIDLLVDYTLDDISDWFPAGLKLDLEKLLDRQVDIATESGLKERIKKRVLNEAIALAKPFYI